MTESKGQITEWIVNDVNPGREIWWARVSGTRFGAQVWVELVEKGYLLVIDRNDRYRRLARVYPTFEQAQAEAARLIAIN